MIPFGAEAYFALFEQYNRTVWPAPLVACVLGLGVAWVVLRPVPWGDRAVAAFLALAWAWNGAVFHLAYFATINFLAPAFAAAFILQGLLFAWFGALRKAVAFRFRPGIAGWTGVVLAAFALGVYPLLAWAAGHGWPRTPLLGVAPAPTAVFTLGLLLLAEGRSRGVLAVVPILWAVVGGSAAWLLDAPEDASLLVAGLAVAASLARPARLRPSR